MSLYEKRILLCLFTRLNMYIVAYKDFLVFFAKINYMDAYKALEASLTKEEHQYSLA